MESLPNSLLFWRSATHFIGGLGVVVFLLLLIPESSQMRMRLTNMELSSLSRSSYSSRTTNVVYIFAYVYLALFVLAVVAYCLAGMSFFDAVCHAMAVVATGGFSTKTASIAAFDSYWVEGVTMLFMYLSSIHFGLLYLTVVTRSLKPLGSPIIKFYTVMVLVVAFFLGIGLKTGGFCQGWGRVFLGRSVQHPDRVLDHRLRQSRQFSVAGLDDSAAAFPRDSVRNHRFHLRRNQSPTVR